MTIPPTRFDHCDAAVDALIAKLGKDLRIGLPLGLGKPTQLVNALYARAKSDPTLQLTILTALSLEKPVPTSALEARFLQPFLDRVFGDCPDLDYMLDLRAQKLPSNVLVKEFFFKPGSNLNNAHAQQHYISTNYTFAARDVFNQGCNVAAQLICKREGAGGTRYSLACNPDTGPELVELMRASGRPHAVVGLINQNLPYMVNDAEVEPALFDFVIDAPRYSTALFSTPKLAVTTPDYAVGLYAAALIKDGGTLQVGIGALGDAVVHAACLRHQQAPVFGAALGSLGALASHGDLIASQGGIQPFEQGLYGATEMFVDGFMHLYQAGILKRAVYDFWALQQLINEGRCNPHALSADVLDGLEALGVRVIRTQDFELLQHHGFFSEATRYDAGHLIAPDGERVIANVANPDSRRVMARCLGTALRHGIVLHGGFFLGPNAFYEALRAMPEAERATICMTGVYKVNQLDHNPRLYKAQRQHARFINSGIMVTLSGAVMSDGLEDGRVVSGVGGQYNFVAMAHQLPTGRSILLIRAVRDKEGKTSAPSSNVVFNYGHITIPRHLRDIVITEYGIADLRSKTDNEVAKALLNIADSRFQDELLAQVKKSGKVEASYVIPQAFKNNTPQALEAKLSAFKKDLPAFPFGTDLTVDEIKLGKALKAVKAEAAKRNKLKLAFDAWRFRDIPESSKPYLERMGLSDPQTMQDKVVRMLLVQSL
ncbi:MAG: acetyl-CoA hydrolase/transferase C-terminal domain-containing protein [Pseudomonadota bacterium]